MSFNIGEGKTTYVILQSILRKSPIICSNEEVRKHIVHSGKILCKKLYPDSEITMPTPITYKEFDNNKFNKSLEYIFDDINEYFKYKGIKIRTLIMES